MGRSLLRPGVLAWLLLSATSASAQTRLSGFELERLELNPGAEGSLVVGMGELLQPGHLRLSMVGHYAHRPLLLSQSDELFTVVGGRTTLHLAGAYALTRWLQVGAQLPVVAHQWSGNLGDVGLARPAAFTLATPLVGARLGLLTQDAQGGLDVALEASVGLPVGRPEGFGSDEGMRYLPRVMVGRRFGFIRAAVDLGLLVRPARPLLMAQGEVLASLSNELRLGAALATTGRRLRWELNVRGMVPLSRQSGAAELLPGARLLVNPSLEVFALAGLGFGSAPGTPTFRAMVGGSFGDVTPHRGPGESSVNCAPGLPHTVEECPDMDEDWDGVLNAQDLCPEVPGTPERKGCPRTDTDSDGLEDMLDMCPTEHGPVSLQGCPVRDQDTDGVEDEVDSCPTEPGPESNHGCPVKDRDGDGIDDDQDSCPAESGLRERQGCPEEDSDKDGVPNRVDSCAREPGVEGNLGCPAHEGPRVELTHEQLKLRGKVYFEPAQARLQARSFAVLEWVAKVMREHPELPRVVVGAHTDDRGLADDNRRLSQQRAEVVRRYLIDKGVPAERLEARGYGPDRPIDINLTSSGRENNRRVDFFLIRDGDAAGNEFQR